MEQNDEQAQSTPAQNEPESRAVGILLNAPSILTRLVDTAVILSVLTGILYVWGTTYYSAFIKGLGLETYAFAFNVPPNEALFGGANALTYLLSGAALVYWSVAGGLMAIIILIAFVHLILLPLLSLTLAPLAAKLWGWLCRRLLKIRALRKLRKVCKKFKAKIPDLTRTERTIARLWSSFELYLIHAVIWSLLVVLLIWGMRKSSELGFEAAKNQLADNPQAEVVFGENEKMVSTLCGRIGSDFIFKSPEDQGKYIIIKESNIKQITMLMPTAKAKPQAPDNK